MNTTRTERSADVDGPAVTRMGRYGQWKKGVLSHEAWDETNNLLDRIEHGGNTQ